MRQGKRRRNDFEDEPSLILIRHYIYPIDQDFEQDFEQDFVQKGPKMHRGLQYLTIMLATCCLIRVVVQNVPNFQALYLIMLLNGYNMDHKLPSVDEFIDEDRDMVKELNKLFANAKKLRDDLATYSQ